MRSAVSTLSTFVPNCGLDSPCSLASMTDCVTPPQRKDYAWLRRLLVRSRRSISTRTRARPQCIEYLLILRILDALDGTHDGPTQYSPGQSAGGRIVRSIGLSRNVR